MAEFFNDGFGELTGLKLNLQSDVVKKIRSLIEEKVFEKFDVFFDKKLVDLNKEIDSIDN